MKAKEIPFSLFSAAKLMLSDHEHLGSDAKASHNNIIVSLTSIESRLAILHLTIRSLLAQSEAPQKILLWLHYDLERLIPKRLDKLRSPRFEIRYSKETCPHRKLVETLRLQPETTVVTCDDDMMYPDDWLARLLAEHRKHPCDVVAHECRRVTVDETGAPLSYTKWQTEQPGGSHASTLAIGYGGVLYPANCLHEHSLIKERYDALAPRADDLWFKVMSHMKGTKTRRTVQCGPKPTPIPFSQKISLKKTNIRGDHNRDQWIALCKHYPLNFNDEE